MKALTLVKAPVRDETLSVARFCVFIDANPNDFVTTRAEGVIRSAIADESLFFVEDEDGRIVATTGFYRHGSAELWGEIGSTLIDRDHQGVRLQAAIYRHIIALKALADWPHELIAVVSEKAIASYRNVERCGFERLNRIPESLVAATPGHNWNGVRQQLKRLYRLPAKGLADCLIHVASAGRTQVLKDQQGAEKYLLNTAFTYLNDPGARAALLALADETHQSTSGASKTERN